MVFQASSLTTLRSSVPGSLAVPESTTLIGIPMWDSRADANLCLFPTRPNVRLPAHTRVRACPWTEMPCGVRRRRRLTGKGASVLCSDCWDLVNGAPAPCARPPQGHSVGSLKARHRGLARKHMPPPRHHWRGGCGCETRLPPSRQSQSSGQQGGVAGRDRRRWGPSCFSSGIRGRGGGEGPV